MRTSYRPEGSSQTRQEVVNQDSAHSLNGEREAVVIPLPVSMHTGQIIMLTKMLIGSDMRFYNFSGDGPRYGWHSTQ